MNNDERKDDYQLRIYALETLYMRFILHFNYIFPNIYIIYLNKNYIFSILRRFSTKKCEREFL